MTYKAEVTKLTMFGVPDYEEQTFDTRLQAEDWIKRRQPFGYSNPKINGEPVSFDDCREIEDKATISDLGEQRREAFRANANRNSLRLLKPSDPSDLADILYAEEDKRCAG